MSEQHAAAPSLQGETAAPPGMKEGDTCGNCGGMWMPPGLMPAFVKPDGLCYCFDKAAPVTQHDGLGFCNRCGWFGMAATIGQAEKRHRTEATTCRRSLSSFMEKGEHATAETRLSFLRQRVGELAATVAELRNSAPGASSGTAAPTPEPCAKCGTELTAIEYPELANDSPWIVNEDGTVCATCNGTGFIDVCAQCLHAERAALSQRIDALPRHTPRIDSDTFTFSPCIQASSDGEWVSLAAVRGALEGRSEP